jgi:hypothetical protein
VEAERLVQRLVVDKDGEKGKNVKEMCLEMSTKIIGRNIELVYL